MFGRCKECGEYADLNPYMDSEYYGLCFVCQMKEVKRKQTAWKVVK